MEDRANFVEDGIDRVQSAFKSVEDEFEKVQKRVDRGRKDLGKRVKSNRKDWEKTTQKFQQRIETRRKNFEKQAEKRVKSIQKELRSYAIVRRIEEIQEDATKRFESGVETVLGAFQIATRGDVKKLDRKLNQINRKLKELEKKRAPRKAEQNAA